MTVRRAVGGDAPALAALNRAVHDMHLARRPDYFKATRADEVTAWFRDRLDESTTAAWIAEAEGRPVGYVLTFFHDRGENAFCRPRRWCEIDQIAVDSAWRRRGVARALMAAALAEAEPRMLRFERRAP